MAIEDAIRDLTEVIRTQDSTPDPAPSPEPSPDEGGGGSNIFTIMFTTVFDSSTNQGTTTCNRTFSEIAEAITDEVPIYCVQKYVYEDGSYPPSYTQYTLFDFNASQGDYSYVNFVASACSTTYNGHELIIYQIQIMGDGTISAYRQYVTISG